MNIANKPTNSFINFLFILILVIGSVVSGFIFYSGNQIVENVDRLVTKKLPTYDLLREISNSVTEQERFLYEFYVTENKQEFLQHYLPTQLKTEQALVSLFGQFGSIPPLQVTREQLVTFEHVSEQLVNNVHATDTNWKLAREQLKTISQVRETIMPQLNHLIDLTKNGVQLSEHSIASGLENVSLFVTFYGLVTLLIAYSVVRAWKAYLVSAASNERLSLFPKRNPNPVISLDKNNNLTFSNPASRRLLEQLGKPNDTALRLLASNLPYYQQLLMADENQDSLLFEYEIDGLFFQCELHWLADQQQWDIHLTDITARKEVERELEFRASHDPETGLKKRYELEKSVDEMRRENIPFSLGVLEIRSYSQLVSSSGLTAASTVVKEVGMSIQHIIAVLGNDRFEAYRIGEKNFVLTSTYYLSTPQIQELIEYIEQKLLATIFHCKYRVKLDFGFACSPEHGANFTELLLNAKAALDKSARNENKRFAIFTPELGAKLRHEQKLTEDLKTAIEQKKFELHFQPQLCLLSNKIVGAEVLVRWQRYGEWISPADFIPLAENAGLITPLGDWILTKACHRTRQIVDLGYQDLVMAVNISPIQFGRPEFLHKVTQALKDADLPAKHLELEITEGVIIYNEQETIDTIEQLKKLGVRLSIDDFGTGYSSLSYLKKFKIDKLKIDQSFVRHIQTESADQSIVRTIIELGRNLNLKLIAEGVEELSQLSLLKSMGCDEIQGYYFSRPLPEPDFIQFLANYQKETL
ncbi:EAL domain-containing protein [Paraglaciecola aquimarina]|uniref:EAL domain-containing protein n=1 Tax=Paraglaciecola aquimarina TaxID=1235557 RepID=A0ABU3SZR4_9ALTE|nr:EAL domain-containing protein [Paraglaciecola aquimarina]MDU0355503.1 EAL domain-containing protein [Paraglaciecola aquimarina]